MASLSLTATPQHPILSPRTSSQDQRARLWSYLQEVATTSTEANGRILVAGCGAGEDAAYLTRLGHQVVATEGDPELLARARLLADEWKYDERPTFMPLDLGAVHSGRIRERFDLILLSFGRLNRFDDAALKRFVSRLPALLRPNGRVVAVLRSPQCIWEEAFSLVDRETQSRRKLDERIDEWHFHEPRQVQIIFEKYFALERLQPIGLVLPPSYLEQKFSRRPGLLRLLRRWEKALSDKKALASLADHFLVDFRLR